MSKIGAVASIFLFLVGIGIFYEINQNLQDKREVIETTRQESQAVVLPTADYIQRRTFNGFGEFSQGSLAGYHVAEDIEYIDVLDKEVPVFSIAPGVVRRQGNVSGYGGVVVIAHDIEGREVNAIYGHIDLGSLQVQQGQGVEKGQFLANLGDHESPETDGERKHLHFGLYEGEELRLQGYEASVGAVAVWINPHDFFAGYGYNMQSPSRMFDPRNELGGTTYPLQFLIPAGWEIEYVRSQDALNLYTLEGGGSSLERSQIFITHFNASNFLTLSSVIIHETQDMLVGDNYTARLYDIEKRQEATPFTGQPFWRNQRHTAVDLRGETGRTRYFSFAANPELDKELYQQILASVRIVVG